MKHFLLITLMILVPGVQAQNSRQVMELKPVGKPSSYVQQMAESLDSADSGALLESYLNSLLKANAINDRNQQPGEIAVLFTVRANQGGELVITRVEKDRQKRSLENRSLLVFGVGSVLDSGCSRKEQRCWVLYPDRNDRWLEISYAPTAIDELAKGIGLLIREMQR